MTFKEKLAMDDPNCISGDYEGGCRGCPSEYGFCSEAVDDIFCQSSSYKTDDEKCTACWNREIPSSEPTPTTPQTPNATLHRSILDEIHQLYIRKNHDYGDSFHATFEEEGWAMVRIRLGDKFGRLKTLSKGEAQMVNDESLRDTLVDLANYAIMSVMEIDRKDNENG